MRTASVSSLSVRDRYDVAAAGRLMCNGLDLERIVDAVVPPEPQWHDGLLERLPGWYGDLARCLANGMPRGTIMRLMGVQSELFSKRMHELEALLNAMRTAAGAIENFAANRGLPAANPPASRRPAVTTSWVSEPGIPQGAEAGVSCADKGRQWLSDAAWHAEAAHDATPGMLVGCYAEMPLPPVASPRPAPKATQGVELIQYTVFEVYANGQLRSEFATEKQARRAASNLRPYCESVAVYAVDYVDAV